MEENIYSLLNCPQVELLVATKKKLGYFFFFFFLLHFCIFRAKTFCILILPSCQDPAYTDIFFFLSKPSSFARTTFGVIFLFFPLIVCAVQQEHVHVQSETVKFLLCGQMTRHVDCKN